MSFIFPPNSKMYLDFTNGIIGIGTTTPSANLHVQGNLTVSGTTNLSSISFGSGITGTLNTAAQPNITSVGTLSNLTVAGTGLVVSSAGNVGMGISTPNANLHVIGPVNLISSAGNTGLYMRLGNVGIGTTNPLANLHIIGNKIITGNVGIGNISNTSNLSIFCNSSNINNESAMHALLINSGTGSLDYTKTCMYLGADATGNVSYIQSSRAGANLPLLLNNRGGNVGINTNSARSTLDVVGDIRLSGLLIGPTSAVTFTSSTIGYTVTFSASSTPQQTNATISTAGLSGFTLPIGVWHLRGQIGTSNDTGTTNVSYTITGFSTSATSFTTTYGCSSTTDNSTRSIGFGLAYTYGHIIHTQYVTMTSSDTLYLLIQPYFTTNKLYCAGYVTAVRIA